MRSPCLIPFTSNTFANMLDNLCKSPYVYLEIIMINNVEKWSLQ